MRFELNALRKKIKAEYKTFGAFALAMGIPYQRLSKLVTAKSDWSREEVYKAAELLNVLDDVNTYFFTPETHDREYGKEGGTQ